MTYDLVIIGGGPAGCAAAVYAARKQLNTVIITESFGGQSIVSDGIENWIGDKHISGYELAKKLEEHVRKYEGESLEVASGDRVVKLEKDGDEYVSTTTKSSFRSKTVLVATGSHRRKLDVPGADEFEHKGITYCASCDGPFFADKDVVVVGGGNAAFESAAQLVAYTKSVTLLQRGDSFRADAVTVEKVLENPNIKALTGVDVQEIKGDKMVESIVYTHNGEEIEQKVDGVFVEIGAIPTTEYAQEVVELDEYNNITIDPWTQRASATGVWAAGDCTNGLYHQNNIAAGDAVKALEDIYLYIKTSK